jgi:hypothetical protein
MINVTLILLRFTVIYLEENLAVTQSNFLQNKILFFISLIGIYFISSYYLKGPFKEFDSELTRLLPSLILLFIREYFSDSKKTEETIMSLTIEKLIKKGFEDQKAEMDKYFGSADKLDPESKDGVIVRMSEDILALKSNFEDGGIIPTIQSDVSTLKSHFEDGGIIPQLQTDVASILKILRANQEDSTPNRRREKTR